MSSSVAGGSVQQVEQIQEQQENDDKGDEQEQNKAEENGQAQHQVSMLLQLSCVQVHGWVFQPLAEL